MAARWKKIFSRKTDSPERRPSRRERRANDNDPTLRASLYDTAEPAALPETGQYPIKGNGSSPALTHRRNSSRGHRKHFSNSEMAPPVPSGPSGPSGQPSGARPMSSNAGGGLRMVQDDTNLSTDLSNLNLSDRDGKSHAIGPFVCMLTFS